MASETLTPDGNTRNVAGAVTDDSNAFVKRLRIDDTTKGLKVMLVGGSGLTLETNGIPNGSQSVLNLAQGSNITLTDNGSGTITIAASAGASGITIGTTTITSGTTTRILYDNAGVVGEYTISGSGTVVAMATSPSFTTPTLGVASATTINKVTLTTPATGSTLTVVDGKTLTASNTLTFTGTDGSSVAFGTGGTVLYGNQSISLSGDISGSGTTAITTTLATVNSNVGTFGSATVVPVITVNGKGLVTSVTTSTITPAVGSITGFGTGVATFLATPTSANLAAAITDETGTGSAVFANKPTFLGTIQTVTAMGAQAIDGSLGNIFTRTLAASETFTQSNFSTGQCFMIEVTNAAGGGDTVTWFSGITWITTGGTAPVQASGASGKTTYGFRCTGSNTFWGYLVGTN